jgi:prohibitin 2
MNSQQEAFRRFAQQLQRASQGGGGFPGGSPRGLFAGGGLLITLIAGGLALNASLFNGKHAHYRVYWCQTK